MPITPRLFLPAMVNASVSSGINLLSTSDELNELPIPVCCTIFCTSACEGCPLPPFSLYYEYALITNWIKSALSLNRPRGELMDLEHNILDTSQAAIWNIETLTILSDECCKNKIIKAECKDKLTIARKNLEQANTDINKLKYLINKLEDYDKINNA